MRDDHRTFEGHALFYITKELFSIYEELRKNVNKQNQYFYSCLGCLRIIHDIPENRQNGIVIEQSSLS